MDLLVTTAQLAEHLNDPHWMIFDVRHDLTDTQKGARAYAQGHIPGAFFRHIDDDLSAPKSGTNGRHPLPDQSAFAEQMAALGLSASRRVVVYDDAGGAFAVRLWWMLRWLGVREVAVLDGGFAKWAAEDRPVTSRVPEPQAVNNDFILQTGMTVDTAFVLAHINDEQSPLLDARAPERFRGEVEPMDPVAGHIPGAANRFFQSNLNADGTFRPAAELRREYLSLLNGRAAQQLVHHCGSGVTGCHNLFAMELAGVAGSRLYPGSWSEWVADRSRPVAQGE
jgi:thiosulfate/3-mercaptopyruvate sulfurtransferase